MTLRLLGASVVACCLTFSVNAQTPPPRDTLPSTTAALRDVMVPMRDGVRLATDIYLPAHDHVATVGRYPTILRRTPYSKDGWDAVVAYFTAHGYAVVEQDTRGRFKS